MLPNIVTNEFGINLTDFGKLGAGVYFSPQCTTSLKYTSCAQNEFRYLLVCDVACGKEYSADDLKIDFVKAPDGYNSVVSALGSKEFESGQEVVVYDTSQISIKYLVQLKLKDDTGKIGEKRAKGKVGQKLLLDDSDSTRKKESGNEELRKAEDLSEFSSLYSFLLS